MPEITRKEELYTADEVAHELNRAVSTIWRWVKTGKIKSVKILGRTRFPKSELMRLKKRHAST